MSGQAMSRLGAASGIAYVLGILSLNSADSDQQRRPRRGDPRAAAVRALPRLPLQPAAPRRRAPATGSPPPPSAPGSWRSPSSSQVFCRPSSSSRATSRPRSPLRSPVSATCPFMVSMIPLGLFLAAVAAIVVRSRVLPTSLGWSAAVVAPLLVANGFDLGAEFGPAFMLFLLWTLIPPSSCFAAPSPPARRRSPRPPRRDVLADSSPPRLQPNPSHSKEFLVSRKIPALVAIVAMSAATMAITSSGGAQAPSETVLSYTVRAAGGTFVDSRPKGDSRADFVVFEGRLLTGNRVVGRERGTCFVANARTHVAVCTMGWVLPDGALTTARCDRCRSSLHRARHRWHRPASPGARGTALVQRTKVTFRLLP